MAANQPAHAGPLSGVPPDEDLPGLLPGEPLLPPRPGDLRPARLDRRPWSASWPIAIPTGQAGGSDLRPHSGGPAGPYRYGKPATAFMLETGLATWADFEWSLDATAHVSPHCLIMERAP